MKNQSTQFNEEMTSLVYPASWLQQWIWENLSVSYLYTDTQQPDSADNKKSTAVLIHGFGANKEHWRHNIPYLSQERPVVAIDLIGFGSSEKPRSNLEIEHDLSGWTYSIDNWSRQVVELINEKIQGPVQLIGNSIGGVVALNVARMLEAQGQAPRQVILIDCAQRALDDKRLANQPLLRRWGRPALKALVKQRWLTKALFRTVARASVIHRVLMAAYPTRQNVDPQLIELLLRPATEINADEAFRGFINLFDDRLAPDLLAQINTPVAMLCGELDPWEPLEEAEKWQSYSVVKRFEVLKGLGHCPHDEAPEVVNPRISNLLNAADVL